MQDSIIERSAWIAAWNAKCFQHVGHSSESSQLAQMLLFIAWH